MTLPSDLREVQFKDFRSLMGRTCREIDDNNEPVLIKLSTNRPGDRRPAVCLPYRLWEQICHRHPDLAPPESQIQHIGSMRDAQLGLSQNILRPAAKNGIHTAVQPSRGEDPWHVVYVPRTWFEEYSSRAQ